MPEAKEMTKEQVQSALEIKPHSLNSGGLGIVIRDRLLHPLVPINQQAKCMSSNFVPGVFISNCLLDLYAKCGSLVDAQKVFDEMGNRDLCPHWVIMTGLDSIVPLLAQIDELQLLLLAPVSSRLPPKPPDISFLSLFSVLPLRKVMVIDFKLTYPSGTATAHLINSFHTPQGAKLAKKQVKLLEKFFSLSFFWGFFQWFYTATDSCGFQAFPSLGLKAYENRFYFDFSATYIGVGINCPYIINISVIIGGILSWGLMWPLIENKKGHWYKKDLGQRNLHGIRGYRVFIAIAIILGDGLYNFCKVLNYTLFGLYIQFRSKQRENVLPVADQDSPSPPPKLSFDDQRRTQLFLKDQIPTWVAIGGYVVIAAISTATVPHIFQQLKWYYILVIYLIAPTLAFYNAYGCGLTGWSLASTYGKLAIFTIRAWAGASHGGILASLVACGGMMDIVQVGDGKGATRLFCNMLNSEMQFSKFTLFNVLKVCANLGDLKDGCIHDGASLFKAMKGPVLVSWNNLLSGFHDNDSCESGPKTFYQMLVEGFKPNMYTFISVLRSCSSLLDIVFGTALVDMYAKGYAQTDQAEKAIKLFNLIQQGLKPNEFTIAGCLSGCSQITATESGMQLHSTAIKSGLLPDMSVSSTLVDIYAKCGSIEDALESQVFVGIMVVSGIHYSPNSVAAKSFNGHNLEDKVIFKGDGIVMNEDSTHVKPNEITERMIYGAAKSNQGQVANEFKIVELRKGMWVRKHNRKYAHE